MRPLTQELEVYAGDAPPPDYSIDLEIEGLSRAVDAAGMERFHLYGHSAGGAIALAYVARFPERVMSLALDEPASDFSEVDRQAVQEVDAATGDQGLGGFLRMQLAEGVEPPAPPPGPPPPWMSSRPAGIEAFVGALARHRLDANAWRGFQGPVYFSHGSLSHPRWLEMRDRLAAAFVDFRSELFEGLHHLNPAHQAEPVRAANSLLALWASAAAAS